MRKKEHSLAEKRDALDAALHVAVGTWAEALYLPFAGADRVPAMITLYKHLHHHLKNVSLGEMKLLNDEFSDALLLEMGEVPDDAPPGTKGVVRLDVTQADGMVRLHYTDRVAAGLPPASARLLAEALLTKAGEIDQKTASVFYVQPKEMEPDAS